MAYKTPKKIENTEGIDTIMYITAANEPTEGWIAWAGQCYRSPITNRPIMGRVNFNTYYLNTDMNDY